MNLNEESISFYHAIGLSITQWAWVEQELAGIVLDCFDPKEAIQALTGFRAIENFRAKLQFVDAVISVGRLKKSEKPNWILLMERAQKAANKRNQLAHRTVITDANGTAGRRKNLLPARAPETKRPQKFAGAICVRDIVGYRLEFFALTAQLANFRARLAGEPERRPRSQEQALSPPTIAQIRREIYVFASTPPKP